MRDPEQVRGHAGFSRSMPRACLDTVLETSGPGALRTKP